MRPVVSAKDGKDATFIYLEQVKAMGQPAWVDLQGTDPVESLHMYASHQSRQRSLLLSPFTVAKFNLSQ